MACKIVKDQDEFNQYLNDAGNTLVMVDFYATWCGPCKVIAPKLEKIQQEEGDNLLIIKVDVDVNEELAANNAISAMPTFIFFKNGKKVGEVVGASENNIREAIAKYKC